MSELTTAPLADTSDMVGLHRVFRDATADGPRLVGAVAPGDREHAELVATYLDNVLRLLHSHHEGEDALLTPKLVQRCTIEDAAEATRVGQQHETVLSDLEATEARIAAWRAEPGPGTAAELTAALTQLGASLTAHLDEEERVVLPLAARHIDVAEWGELPAHGMAHFTGDKMWLVLGLIQEQMTPEQIALMEQHMPPPVAQSWTTTGRPMFLAFVAQLRG